MTLGDVFILALALLILAWILSYRSISPRVRTLLAAGLVLRIVGGQLYYLVGEMVYEGTADYWTYFRNGTMYAQALLAGTPEASGSLWLERGEWCCTAFTIKTSGVIIAGLEPSVFGLFVLFSLIGFGGIVAFAVAFWRAFPAIRADRYLLWLVIFPSLWYWPTALGKDALMIAGIGIAILGFVGKGNRVNVLVLGAGTALVFAVRPQVAVVLLFAFVAGYWLFIMRRASLSRVAQGALVALIGVGVLLAAQNTLGLTLVDVGDAGEYLTGTQAAVARMEGSSITSGGNPIVGFINVMMRPFPWEARSIPALIGGLEIAALWVIGWRRRAEVRGFVRAYRGHRLFWVAVVFIVAYAAALGMGAGNMGVIARQRIHVFPFVFMFFAGVPSHRRTTPGTSPVPRRASRPAATI